MNTVGRYRVQHSAAAGGLITAPLSDAEDFGQASPNFRTLLFDSCPLLVGNNLAVDRQEPQSPSDTFTEPFIRYGYGCYRRCLFLRKCAIPAADLLNLPSKLLVDGPSTGLSNLDALPDASLDLFFRELARHGCWTLVLVPLPLRLGFLAPANLLDSPARVFVDCSAIGLCLPDSGFDTLLNLGGR